MNKIKDLFLEDKKIFDESFIYGRHYIVVGRLLDSLKICWLRKSKNRLKLDIGNPLYLPLVKDIKIDSYPVGSWIFGVPTQKRVMGRNCWEWEYVTSFLTEEEQNLDEKEKVKRIKKKFKNGAVIGF